MKLHLIGIQNQETIVPGLTIKNFQKFNIFLSTLIGVLLTSCGVNVETIANNFSSINQQDPALSGNGKIIAMIVEKNGRPTLELLDVKTKRVIPLRHLSKYQPHSSPSLSWNARYVAVITQDGNTRLGLLEDRLSGRLHRMYTSRRRVPVRLSLSPDGTQLAMQITDKGKWRIEMYNLMNLIEPDRSTNPFQQREIQK